MYTIMIIDDKHNLRITKKESTDLSDFNIFVNRSIDTNFSLFAVIVAHNGLTGITLPLKLSANKHNEYNIYTIELTNKTISGLCSIWLFGININTKEYFSTDSLNYEVTCAKYKNISTQMNSELINNDISSTFKKIQKLTELNIRIHDEIRKAGDTIE